MNWQMLDCSFSRMVVDQSGNSYFAVIISGLVLISSLLLEMFSYATIFNGNNDGSFTEILSPSIFLSQNKSSFRCPYTPKRNRHIYMGSNFEMVFLYQISSEQNKTKSTLCTDHQFTSVITCLWIVFFFHFSILEASLKSSSEKLDCTLKEKTKKKAVSWNWPYFDMLQHA